MVKVAGRVLAAVFWNSIGVLLLNLLLRGHLTAIDTVLDWKSGEKPSGEEVPVFVFMWWFCSLRMPDHKQHGRLVTSCRISVGKHWTIPHTVGICQTAIFILFLPSRSTCHDIASSAMIRRPTCYHHVGDATGTYVCTSGVDKLTALWQVPRPSRGLSWKIVSYWQSLCTVSSLG